MGRVAARHRSLTEAQQRWLTLLAMCAATFMISLDVTIVNVALPAIQRELHMPPGDLEWVISAYSLSLAAVVPVSGALGDRYGRKRLFLIGMAIFALGSIARALSSSDAALIAFRAVQGVGGAAMLALTLSIITETFPPATRAGAIGTWAAIGGTGFGAGPVAGGILLTFFGWTSVFWVNVPFAVIGVVGTAVAVRESRDPQSRRLDVPGVATSAAGLVAVTLGLIESASYPWGSWPVAAPLVVGAAFLVGFALWERRAPHAMVPPVLLRARSFVSASGIYLISYARLSGVLFYVTLLYQDVNRWSVLRTGLSWLFMNAPFLLMAQFAGRLDRRFSATAVVATGCLVAAIGVFALSTVTTTTPFVLTAVGYLLFGAGFGTMIPGTTHVAMRDVPPGVSGAASGVLNASRQIGTSVGLAVLGAIGVNAAVSDWNAETGRFPASIRAIAPGQAQNVGGAASKRSPIPSAPPTGTPPPNRLSRGTTSLSASARCACWPPRSSLSAGSGGPRRHRHPRHTHLGHCHSNYCPDRMQTRPSSSGPRAGWPAGSEGLVEGDRSLGEGAGLVGEQDLDVAQVLDGDQPLDQHPAAGQLARPARQADADDRREQLRADTDGDGQREPQRLQQRPVEGDIDDDDRGRQDRSCPGPTCRQ
jgi:DHA2 family methylenomycin A resistance protein-like MFS transporter